MPTETINKPQPLYTPFVRARDSVWEIMSDVLLALVPCAAMSYFAYGEAPFLVMFVAVISAVLAEFVFAAFFLNKKDTLKDGSAIVTAILLSFTLAPFTPWYVVAFGAAMAVIFGKILWGGLGRNILNPALVGREFMTVFFPAIMTSGSIWYNKDYLNFKELSVFNIFGDSGLITYLNSLFFKSSGAIGEYSVIFLVLGGVYLLLRRRISWHIPFALLVTFFILLQVFAYKDIRFSVGGLLLGTIFMATDMPSSASTKNGKLYYGAMIGLVAILCLLNDVRHEYMSYSILLVNAFVVPINWAFKPVTWGKKANIKSLIKWVTLITAGIVAATYALIYLHHVDCVRYLVFAYIIFLICRFCFMTMKDIEYPKSN
ncbi:RnfABCDGE type electron transport complex subunit D [Dysgonomonas macrotermitis]|uniref:Electron transport complex protein RnfD n=1 Tax=Dysgonomonas macrotermitis TaxID=1346286 RepID=A0A1M4ZX07_9BACT|nr:RnfABCDGE type electron transport complex subunit D [Dysgonomonas macrotermitis]SHF22563.1 electron transport complex protein RnfD [Dysgonomonas macrotermitis]